MAVVCKHCTYVKNVDIRVFDVVQYVNKSCKLVNSCQSELVGVRVAINNVNNSRGLIG